MTISVNNISENIQKNETAAKSTFPNEQWVDAQSIKLAQEGPDFEIPNGIDNIKNVYIRVMNPGITKNDVIQKMYTVVNSSEYTGGLKGNLIFSVRTGNFDNLHHVRISDLKK